VLQAAVGTGYNTNNNAVTW